MWPQYAWYCGYMRRPRVGIRELKNDLSRWVARARRGEEVLVTDRGTTVARLGPVEKDDPLERLIAQGLVEPAEKSHRSHRLRPVRLRGKGPTMSEYVLANRR